MDVSEAANHVIGSRHFEHATTNLAVAVTNFVYNCFQRDLESQQPVRVEFDLVLLYEAADGSDFRNSRYRFECVAHIPVLQAAKVGETVIVTLIDQSVFVYPPGAGCVRTYGRINARG